MRNEFGRREALLTGSSAGKLQLDSEKASMEALGMMDRTARTIALAAVVALVTPVAAGCGDDSAPGVTCTRNADCPLKVRPICNVATGQCVAGEAGVPDAGGDAGPGDDARPDVSFDLPTDVSSPDLKKTKGATCGGNNECISNQCVDGVCCNVASCGPCQNCKTGKGSCAADDADGNAKKDCDGQDAACNGTCSGGQCDYSATNATVCGAVNCNTTTLTSIDEVRCKDGVCADNQTRACTPTFTLCDTTATPDACRTGCETHADCDGGAKALCDRTQAHTTGLGSCVDPAQVTLVTSPTALQAYFDNPAGWAKITSGTYTGVSFNVANTKIARVAGATTVNFGLVANSAFVVTGPATNAAHLVLQDVAISNATQHGILCDKPTSSTNVPSLVIVESTVASSGLTGITASNCSLTLRRSTINQNGGGGLNLSTGTFIITNTLITGNGVANSTFGGVALASASGTSLFEHNTVIDNYVNSTQPAGVTCAFGPVSVRASIITGNENSQTSGCTLDSLTNTTDCGATQTNSYKPSLAACLDTAATTTLTLDRASGPRVKGSGPDLGCYEVQ
jgi:hypothetical protein